MRAATASCGVPTPAERNALVFFAALAALGLGVRGLRVVRATPGHSAAATAGALDTQIAAVDSATTLARRAKGRRVANKAVPRGSADTAALPARQPGVRGGGLPPRGGGAVPAASASPANPMALYDERRRAVEASNADARRRLAELAGPAPHASPQASPQAPPQAPARPSVRRTAPARRAVDLDTADEGAIAGVPWIGPALAARIVDDRLRHGPFGSLAGLQRVRGIGPGLAERVRQHVTFSRQSAAPPQVIRFRKRQR